MVYAIYQGEVSTSFGVKKADSGAGKLKKEERKPKRRNQTNLRRKTEGEEQWGRNESHF